MPGFIPDMFDPEDDDRLKEITTTSNVVNIADHVNAKAAAAKDHEKKSEKSYWQSFKDSLPDFTRTTPIQKAAILTGSAAAGGLMIYGLFKYNNVNPIATLSSSNVVKNTLGRK